jgi:ADP-ribose pyrophosphatase
MTNNPERTILAEGRHLRLVREGHWEYADRTKASAAVVLVAMTDNGQLLLTEQYRIPVARRVIELPAGLVGDIAGEEHEALATAAERELLEETGYRAAQLTQLSMGPPSAGLATEIVAFFLCAELTKVSRGGGVEHEQIQVHEVRLDEVAEWLEAQARRSVLIDPKVYAGLYFVHRFGNRETPGLQS